MKLTLKECLEAQTLQDLKNQYINIKEEQGKKVKKIKDLTKEKLIEKLIPIIIESFKNYVIIMNKQDLNELLNSKNLEAAIALYFAYPIKDKKSVKYVVPQELIEISNNAYQLDNEIANQKFIYFISFYAIVNGILAESFIKDIINHHEIMISPESISTKMQALHFTLIKSYYVSSSNLNLDAKNQKITNEKMQTLINEKEKLSFKLLTSMDIMLYRLTFMELNSFIMHVLNPKKEEDLGAIISKIISYPTDTEELIDKIHQKLHLTEIQENQLYDYFDDNLDEIRYWSLNGRTPYEYEEEQVRENYILESIPQDDSLETCLKSLRNETYQEIVTDYLEEDETQSIKDLIEQVEEAFEENLNLQSQTYYKMLQSCHKKELEEENLREFLDDIKCGALYIYKDQNKVKVFIPKEIKQIIDNTDINELYDDEDDIINYLDFSDLPF